jgi:sterol 3beta-glucosyltransferase
MRISLVANGSRGDAQPFVVLGHELGRRGHHVTLGVSPNLVAWGERAGLRSVPLGPDSQKFFETPEGRQWLAAGDAAALTQALGKANHDNAGLFDADTLRVCEGAEVIVTGSLGEHRAACVAEARGIPLVCLHYAPTRPTRAYPNMLITTQRLSPRRNLATHSVLQRKYWRSMADDINRFRAALGLAAVDAPTSARLAAADTLELQAYHRALVPDLDDYPGRRPIIGSLVPDRELRERLGENTVDPVLDDWLAAGDPPVYVGFGSMPVTDPAALLDMITGAIDRIGGRAVIGVGWSRFGSIPAVSTSAVSTSAVSTSAVSTSAESRSAELRSAALTAVSAAGTANRVRVVTGVLNYAQVLPRCRLAVHHGGSGTVAASVAAGIPTFVCSVVSDNPFWGARVQELGLGAHERFADLTADTFEAGLRRALQAPVIARAREVGAVVRADTGAVHRAADLIVDQLPT